MLVDVGRRLAFPPEIATTTLRPDMVLWSPSLKKVFIIELTIPWEHSVDEAYEWKRLRYAELAAEAQHRGWNTEVRPVEVGYRGFVAASTIRLLRDLGIKGQSLRQAVKAVSEAASGCGCRGKTPAGPLFERVIWETHCGDSITPVGHSSVEGV
ncbi:hypothetical protein ABVT39_026468 [Epinephelus coioides]